MRRSLKGLYPHLTVSETQDCISAFCSQQGIKWCFTTKHAPHFGGRWEAAIISFKHHFKWIVGSVWLTFEELTTVFAQIEACLNSRPLTPLPHPEDGTEVLTPGHFLVGAPLEALPDSSEPLCLLSILCRWHIFARHSWATFGNGGPQSTYASYSGSPSGNIHRVTYKLVTFFACGVNKLHPRNGHLQSSKESTRERMWKYE